MSWVIIFDSIWFLSKNNNKTKFFLKKNQNRFKPTDFSSVWFFKKKPVWLSFFSFALFFPVLLGFFSICSGLGSVWFFRFQAYKTEPVSFFKILIGLIDFFSQFGFFYCFFSGFLIFSLTPIIC
jgi:hypothetical protein